jgi:hypothetical protein
VRPEGLGKLIKVFHFIGSRTRDLSACNTTLKALCSRTYNIFYFATKLQLASAEIDWICWVHFFIPGDTSIRIRDDAEWM